MPTHADVNATTYRMGAEEALVLLRFRCATIKYKHPVPFARILDGDADPLADILVYVVSRFSEPIAEVLRAHDLYPPPRWSSGASERPREVLEHALLCLDVVAPEANAWIGPADFVRTADQVPQRLKFVLQFIKHFVTRHNAVVASNKAILQQDAVSRPRRTQPNPNSSSDLESLSDSATLPASSPTEHGSPAHSKAIHTSSTHEKSGAAADARRRWVETEFFDELEVEMYREQLQLLFPSQAPAANAGEVDAGFGGRGRIPTLDADVLGLTRLQGLTLTGAEGGPPELFEQIFSFQETTA